MGNKTTRLRKEATLGKIDEMTATVFISDVYAINPERRDRIFELKIKHILTASRYHPTTTAAHQPLPGIKRDYLCIRDTYDENLLASGLLARGLKIIEEADSRGERILVHCRAGISRSVTLVCAHLMKKHKWSVDTALARIRDKRPAAEPNESFLCQLGIFERCNYNAEPSTIVKSPAYLKSLPALMKFGAVPPSEGSPR